MPATMTTRELEAFGGVHRHQPDARLLRALGLVCFGQQRQTIDEAAERRHRPRATRIRARPTRAPSGSRSGLRLPRCVSSRRRLQIARRDRASRPRVVDTLAPAMSLDEAAIRSRKALSAVSARGGSSLCGRAPIDQPRPERPRRRRAAADRRRAAAMSASLVADGSMASSDLEHASCRSPRAGTFTTRRKLTSSCGLMRGAGRRARP